MEWRVAWLSVCLSLNFSLLSVADDEKAEKPPVQKKDEPQPAVVNPLQQLFQQLLSGPRQQPRPKSEQAPPPQAVAPSVPAADPDVRDHIDARAPKDRKQSELLRKAAAAVHKYDWPAALDLLQAILGQNQDVVERSGEIAWQSVRERAIRLLQKMPADVVQTFRQRWSAEAPNRRQKTQWKEAP